MKSQTEYPKFKMLLAALIFGKHSQSDHMVWMKEFGVTNYLVPNERRNLRINITDSYSEPAFSGELFTYLANLFDIKVGDIEIGSWQVTVRGCRSCGDGQRAAAHIDIKNVLFIDDITLETKAENLRLLLNAERAAEEAEEARIAAARQAEEDERANERRRLWEIEEAKINIWLNTFTVNKDKILENILTFYEDTKGLDRKEFALKHKNSPYFPLAAKFRGLKDKSSVAILSYWNKYTEGRKHQIELATAFANSKD